jgi:hypothetical protein
VSGSTAAATSLETEIGEIETVIGTGTTTGDGIMIGTMIGIMTGAGTVAMIGNDTGTAAAGAAVRAQGTSVAAGALGDAGEDMCWLLGGA